MIKIFRTWCSASLIFLFLAPSVEAAQGQWGGFLYLFLKPGIPFSADDISSLSSQLESLGRGFENDFHPGKGKTETIQYYRTNRYTLRDKAMEAAPQGLIKVESLDREKVEQFIEHAHGLLEDRFFMEVRYGVTRQLNYTDAKTLERLKENAPTRGNGRDQPNAVVFPLSKSAKWWGMTQEKRTAYFFKKPDRSGESHLGHNEIGFLYIQKIFRKLYHSRFVNAGQDFVTYFEYADADSEAFNKLLNGLRNETRNPEWKFVNEEPIFWGKRLPDPTGMFP